MRGPEPSEPIADAGRGGIQVVRRAAQILRALDGEPAGLSLSAIAERNVFLALNAWLVSRGWSLRTVFWITGGLSFFF